MPVPDLKIRQVEVKPPIELVAAYKELQVIHNIYAEMATCIEQVIGRPICISCGRCCESTGATMWILEGKYASSWLVGQGPVLVKEVLDRCEGWLLEKDPALTIREGLTHFTPNSGKLAKLLDEINYIMLRTKCPFLTSDKRCLIYEARPLICRAFGVTRLAHPRCLRPPGLGETSDSRIHIGPDGIKELKKRIEALRSREPFFGLVGFAPTIIFSNLKPHTFANYLSDNKIPTAKLYYSPYDPSILWQEQLSEVWAMEETIKV